MTTKILVSTTDLTDHREMVLETLYDMALEPIYIGFDDISVEFIGGCDVFVMLVGDGYGEVLPGDDHSLIEQEYNRACLLGKPRLVYIHDTYKTDPNRQKFIDRLRSRELCSQFTTPQNLATQVEYDLGRLFSQAKAERRFRYMMSMVILILMFLTILVMAIIASLPPDRRDNFLYQGGLIPPTVTSTSEALH